MHSEVSVFCCFSDEVARCTPPVIRRTGNPPLGGNTEIATLLQTEGCAKIFARCPHEFGLQPQGYLRPRRIKKGSNVWLAILH